MGVDPIPNAFVVYLGYQLEIVGSRVTKNTRNIQIKAHLYNFWVHVISNGRLKSVEHRGILNSTTSRTSIVAFFGPNPELPIIVEPAKELVTSSNPQMYKAYRYNEFIATYLALAYSRRQGSHKGFELEPYRL
ncbi:hypothetical protein R6Q57_017509 [Mikania cordata]